MVFNATPATTTQTVASLAGRRYELHPVQERGSDPVVRASRYDARSGAFAVPARTVAVFVDARGGTRTHNAHSSSAF